MVKTHVTETSVWRPKNVSLCPSCLKVREFLLSVLLTTGVATHPDVGRGYLVFLTISWSLQVDPLHPDQRAGNPSTGLLLLK